ncbi:MlaD family protein [Nocardia sp. CS682]|uniref:MlaD family protein n=1 Tax=Nocardia sp. CS682 TaxID=1047172 RepID=UPI001075654E|nr:MCE family protein [Nocardia sp. CS682]QBS39895.1 MCE family protein [Nocardia sp. CS682]
MTGAAKQLIGLPLRLFGEVEQLRAEKSDSWSQLRWGIAGVLVSVLGLLAAAVLYVVPFGEQSYTADFRNSGGARTGDEVRIAGIKVGQVRSVELVGDHVEVRFGVDREVRVGDASSVAVKMLTPIGGHYLSLAPQGERALGSKHIPPERTTTPFELTDIIDVATPVLSQVDGTTLRSTIAEVNAALAGQPDAVRSIIGNFNDLTGVLAERSTQLDSAVRVSDEYIGAIATDRAVLADFVRELGGVAVVLGQRRGEVVQVFELLKRFFAVLHRPVMAYGDSIEPSVAEFEELFNKLVQDPGRLDTVIAGIKDFIGKISAMLGVDGVTIDQSASVIRGPALCIPFEGRAC